MTMPASVRQSPHIGTLVWAVIAILVILGLYHLVAGRRR